MITLKETIHLIELLQKLSTKDASFLYTYCNKITREEFKELLKVCKNGKTNST